MKKKEVDIHDIITKLYNYYLNDFIAKYYKGKSTSRVLTGGLKDIVEKEFSPLNRYCEWLENYRKQLFYACGGKIDIENLKEVLTPLLYFYRKVLVESKNVKTLETELLKPIEKFFIEIDKDYTGEYFSRELEEIQKNLIELKIVLRDERERPITNTSIIFRNSENQEELWEKSIYFSFSTDREGRVCFFIPTGEYIMKIPKYNHSEKIKVEKNAEILRVLKRKSPIFSIFKSSLPKSSLPKDSLFEDIINKTRFLLSMFLPFLIGLSITYLLVKLGLILSPVPSADIGLSAVITFYLPSSYIAVFLLWLLGGMIGMVLYNRIIISMISMLLLSWTNFLLALNEISFSYLEHIANSHWLPSLPIILIINTIVMILAFMIGAATINMIRKKIRMTDFS